MPNYYLFRCILN